MSHHAAIPAGDVEVGVQALQLVKNVFQEEGELTERQFVNKMKEAVMTTATEAELRALFMAIDVDSNGTVR